MCQDKNDPKYQVRLDKESFDYAVNSPYYQKIASCRQQEVENKACYCPKGFYGALCQEDQIYKYYV